MFTTIFEPHAWTYKKLMWALLEAMMMPTPVHTRNRHASHIVYDPGLEGLCSNRILMGFNLIIVMKKSTSVTHTLISWKHRSLHHQNTKLVLVWSGVMLVDPIHGASAPWHGIHVPHILTPNNFELPLKSVTTCGKTNGLQCAMCHKSS